MAVVIGSVVVVTAARRTGSPLSAASLAQVVSALAGAALVARGVVALPGSQAAAYRWFIRGVLVWLLLTQVFAFYSSQLLGLGGLAVNLAAYITLRYALGHEIERGRPDTRDAAVVGRPGPAPDPERQGHPPPGSSRLARSRSGRHVGARAPGVVDAIRTAGST